MYLGMENIFLFRCLRHDEWSESTTRVTHGVQLCTVDLIWSLETLQTYMLSINHHVFTLILVSMLAMNQQVREVVCVSLKIYYF
jgi:hypothetical protein